MKKAIIKSSFALVSLLAVTAVLPRQANAQFAVFDAGNWAMMAKVWASDASTTIKMEQELQQGLKLYQNAVQVYGLASQEASYLRNKQILMAVGVLAQHAIIPGQPGWDRALTAAGGIANAGLVWTQMSGGRGFNAINSRINMAASFGASTLAAIGSCNAAAVASDSATGALEQMAISMNPSANTRATQANLGNMSQTQTLRIMECQHNLQLQQAKMQLLVMQAQNEQDQFLIARQTSTAAVMAQVRTSDTVQDINRLEDR